MKIKSGFVLHTVGGENVIVPIGARTRDFHGMVRLNETGVFLWERMSGDFTREELAGALTDSYDVGKDQAISSVDAFLATLIDGGLVEE